MTPDDIKEMQEAALKWQDRLLSQDELLKLHKEKETVRDDLRGASFPEHHVISLTKDMTPSPESPETKVPDDPNIMFWIDNGQWYKRIREGEIVNGVVYTGMDWFQKINKPEV